MKDASARTTYLQDYQPPAFLIETTELDFDLYEDHALVESRLRLRRNPAFSGDDGDELVLHGRELALEGLWLDGRELTADDYRIEAESLRIPGLALLCGGDAAGFTLRCRTRIEPQNNTALEGLYKSRKMFCTQCEAEGFRRITYFLDRPDVMSKFTTTIRAERDRYPVLLSNGNCLAEGDCEVERGHPPRHWRTWEDPFPKPSYLFALVAGDLASLDDRFTTASGREVALRIFVEPKDLDKCDHAMVSLKKAMRWDEEKYGREYDLDVFMIVAVDDFNMGAMENKGLNIFNTSCILANPRTQTDWAFQRVEAVVAHEYFHNWSGNRVTCRDWFQLSLKEGFTVFRDSQFSADMNSPAVKRVQDVAFLRSVQFAEDSGPMAHSVQPDSYMEISNFYTVTIYEKGAEVVSMIANLLGPERFRAGTDRYFERHDGQAVTIEEFVRAMEDTSGVDLKQFRNWYRQAGTPVLEIDGRHDAEARRYELRVRQSCPPTPGQERKQPFHIPLRIGLLGPDGGELPLRLAGEAAAVGGDRVLAITESEQTFVFEDVAEPPVPSLLRGFSAPVRLKFAYSPEQLLFLLSHDSDGFNRWNAGQELALKCMADLQRDFRAGKALALPEPLRQAHGNLLGEALDSGARASAGADRAMLAELLRLPSESYLIEQAETADVEAIHAVREFLLDSLAEAHSEPLGELFASFPATGTYRADANAIANRSLRNLSLGLLARAGAPDPEKDTATKWIGVCQWQFASANNMTDQLAALQILGIATGGEAAFDATLAAFYQQWRHEPLVVDQWFSAQAARSRPGALGRVRELLRHADFNLRNPNKVRAVIGAFCGQNHINFHDASGAGYEFLGEQAMQLDAINPQIAARLITPLTRWRKFDSNRQQMMREQLHRIGNRQGASRDISEIVVKSLGQAPTGAPGVA